MHPVTFVNDGVPVTDPPILKRPALEKVIWHPVVPVVIAPVTVSTPVEIVMMLLLPEVVAFIVSEPRVRVPLPTAKVQLWVPVGTAIDILPVTVSALALQVLIGLLIPMVTVVLALAAAKVNEATVYWPSIVILAPLAMVTSSTAPTPCDLKLIAVRAEEGRNIR